MRRLSISGFFSVVVAVGFGLLLTSCGDDDIGDIRPGHAVEITMDNSIDTMVADLRVLVDHVVAVKIAPQAENPLPTIRVAARPVSLQPQYHEAFLTDGQNFPSLDRRRS